MRIARASINGSIHYGELRMDGFHVLEGNIFGQPRRTGERIESTRLALLSPTQPRMTYLILGGFLHEGTMLPPGATPQLTTKVVTSVSGDGAQIVVPSFVHKPLWIEVELGVVIGRRIRGGSRTDAHAAIWGYTTVNDVSASEYMYDDETMTDLAQPDYFRSKSVDTFAVMGPCVRTDLTEEQVVAGLTLVARVNGTERAGGTTRLAKFAPSDVVHFIAQQTTLERGDVISLGTPQPCDASPGDQVEVEIEGIGTLRNLIVAASA